MDFFGSLDPRAMKNFDRVDLTERISDKINRIRFNDIQHPTPRFLHRWLSFTLFPTRELCFVTLSEQRCLYAMVHKVRYASVADIVDHFKEIRTLSGPIECTSLVTRIALNLGCPEMTHVSYIGGDVPTLGLPHFVHVHVLREEPDSTISMLYAGGGRVVRLPNPALRLYSYRSLILQGAWLEDVRHSYSGPPRIRSCLRREAAVREQATTQVSP